jgi:hypothetical protein
MTNKWGVNTDEFDKEIYGELRPETETAGELAAVTSEDIDFVFECMAKEAPHDKQFIKQIFYGMLSAFTRLVMHHAISSKDSGAGKTYILVLVAGYMPQEICYCTKWHVRQGNVT